MNDIKKLRRLMRTAHVLQNGDTDHKLYDKSFALKVAWELESIRDILNNGFAVFTYIKEDGSIRTAFGTRSYMLIPPEKTPKPQSEVKQRDDLVKSIPYFDLEKREWRSFSVENFSSLDDFWRFNDTLPFNITPDGDS